MLPNEIEPFADHHAGELRRVKNLLKTIQLRSDSPQFEELYPEFPTTEDIEDAINKINQVQNALQRFKVCTADEVRQKNLYRDRWLALRDKQ